MPVSRMFNRDGSVTVERVPACCRCGFCCHVSVCPLGVEAFGLSGASGASPAASGGVPPGCGPAASGPSPSPGVRGASGGPVVASEPVPGPCPGLSVDGSGVASCALLTSSLFLPWWSARGVSSPSGRAAAMGAGAGCCIRARVVAGGRTLQFAPLPDSTKRAIADRAMRNN
jgi:hypothetical protein